MRDYGKVETALWSHDKMRSLSDDGKLLFVFLITSPHSTMTGCFRAPAGYVSEDLGWPSERVLKAFGELSERGMITRDEASQWLVVHNFLKWNRFENPNVGKAAEKLVGQIDDANPVKPVLAKEILLHGRNYPDAAKAELETLLEGFAKPCRNQEQEPEPEPEPEPSFALVAASAPTAPQRLPDGLVQQAFDEWNAMATRAGLPKARSLTKDRRRHLESRLRSDGLNVWREALAKVEASPHCTGVNDRGWKADLDFLFQAKSWNRLLEGTYDHRPAANQNNRGGRRDWDPIDQALNGINWDAPDEDAA